MSRGKIIGFVLVLVTVLLVFVFARSCHNETADTPLEENPGATLLQEVPAPLPAVPA